jgi:bifunctional N-acetylglucosamine-1-phosphate-uridyltransferase/glucosamine-1-phosphate-acetyltransferase GlmU-like protein
MEHNAAKEYYFLDEKALRSLPPVMGSTKGRKEYYVTDLIAAQIEKFGEDESERMRDVREDQKSKKRKEQTDGKFSASFDHAPRRSIRTRKSTDFLMMG